MLPKNKFKEDPKYQKYLLKEYKHWKIYLHEDQGVLGRSYLWCKREDATDFLEMTKEEKEEFFLAASGLKQALIKTFQPDMFNYAALGNVTYHLHIHVLPRYKTARHFVGKTFKDKGFGHSYHTQNLKLSEKTLQEIKEKIIASF